MDQATATDQTVEGLAFQFTRKQLSAMLDDARDMENGKGRDAEAWEQMADLLWQAYSNRKD